MLTRRLLATFVILLLAGVASAQQPGPQLLSVFPPGAKSGDTVEVTCSGHNLDGGEKLLFSAKGFESEPVGSATNAKGQQGQPTSTMKFKVKVPKETSGTLDVRVVTKTGLSNPRAFVVSNMTDVSESESNNDVGQAQKIELETTVNGVISAPTDVDFVTFQAKKDQNITVYCLTTSVDSRMVADLMVSGPDGKELVSNRNYRGGDAVLDFKAPTDGEYFVRLSQFAYTTGGYDHFYRLTVTTQEWVEVFFPPYSSGAKPYTRTGPKPAILQRRDLDVVSPLWSDRVIPPTAAMIDARDTRYEAPGGNITLFGGVDGSEDGRAEGFMLDNEKNTTPDTAQEVKLPCDIAGRILKKNERHWYSFGAKKGDVWTLEVFAERIGSPVDAYFVITDEKGKTITEQDDGADSLSPNQFYTKGDDPGRYRFAAPADGTYKVMVSTREAGMQFGVRNQYVLRIAKEKPDFRIAVMPMSTHIPDAGTLPKGGAAAFTVFVFRFDGFNDAIELSASDLPNGVTCPPQVIGVGQTRGTLVLVADTDAEDWDGFVKIEASAGERKHAARPFAVTWPTLGVQANQIPNSPTITRMDRGDGMALAVRGEAPYTLTPSENELTVKPGGKLEVTLKVTRAEKFKDAIAIYSTTPGFGPRQQGNNQLQPVGTASGDAKEVKVSLDVPNSLASGTHTLVFRGVAGGPAPKGGGGGNNTPRVQPTYAALPITVKIEDAPKKK